MKKTPNLQLPYPEDTDHTRLWEHFSALALEIDKKVPPLVRAGKRHTSNQTSEPRSYRPGAIIELPASSWAPITIAAAQTDTLLVSIGAQIRNRNTNASSAVACYQVYANGTTLSLSWETTGTYAQSSGQRMTRTSVVKVTKGAALKIVPAYRFSSISGSETWLRYGLLIVQEITSDPAAQAVRHQHSDPEE